MTGTTKPNMKKFKIGVAKNTAKIKTKGYKAKVNVAQFHKSRGMNKPNVRM